MTLDEIVAKLELELLMADEAGWASVEVSTRLLDAAWQELCRLQDLER